MKKLLILVSLLAAGRCLPALTPTPSSTPGFVAQYHLDGNLNDSGSFGCNLTQTGAVGFVSSPAPAQGTQMAGIFNDSVYLSGGSCLLAAMQGSSNWSVSGYFYINAVTIDQMAVMFYVDAGNNYWIQPLNNGALRLGKNGLTYIDTATGLISTGALYYFAMTGSPTELKGYVSPAGSIDYVADLVMPTDATMFPTLNAITIGKSNLSAGRVLNGYIDDLTFSLSSNLGPTATPTPGIQTSTATRTPTPAAPAGTATATPSATPPAVSSSTPTQDPTATPPPAGPTVQPTTVFPPGGCIKIIQNRLRGQGRLKFLVRALVGGRVQIKVLDSRGRNIRLIYEGSMAKDEQRTYDFDGKDDGYRDLPSGAYVGLVVGADGKKHKQGFVIIR